MAAIGKIRSWGPTLVVVIGLALFAFIAEEFFRSCQATSNEQRQQVGQVLGKKISVQEFNDLVEEQQEMMKIMQQRENFSDEELNQIKDQVWEKFVMNTMIGDECEKLGLMVTQEELQNLLMEGTNPMLMNTPFFNQQTRRFDVASLQKFLNDYKNLVSQGQATEQYTALYKYWQYTEKEIRQNLLLAKYRTLLSSCMLSNPVAAEMAFNDQNIESSIVLGSLAYNSINDNDVQISDAELKAKYNEEKEKFKSLVETRDIKYVRYQVTASDSDRAALMATMVEAQKALEAGVAPAEVNRKAKSLVPYTGIFVTRAALPLDIAGKVDSMNVGETSAPFETRQDNTLNVVKLIAKTQMPDSIEYRAINVGQTSASLEQARTTADSIYQALKAGAVFDSIAHKYGQEGSKQWLTSKDYQRTTTLDADSKAFIDAINNGVVGEYKNIELSQGNIILLVTNRKAMVNKYDLAIVKHTIEFSKQTYTEAYNKFSQFVSSCKTLDDVATKAADFQFVAQDYPNFESASHTVAGIRGTREALKWVFDAKENQVSPLYECGNNDCLLVVALSKIHKKGYADWESQKDILKAEVLREKKFELLSKKLEGVKNIADAQKQGANIDTVSHITFSAPVYIMSIGASEPALNGAVAAANQGDFSKKVVKGNAGAYVFQVIEKKKRDNVSFNAKSQEQTLKMQNMQALNLVFSDLIENADIIDNRYLFF